MTKPWSFPASWNQPKMVRSEALKIRERKLIEAEKRILDKQGQWISQEFPLVNFLNYRSSIRALELYLDIQNSKAEYLSGPEILDLQILKQMDLQVLLSCNNLVLDRTCWIQIQMDAKMALEPESRGLRVNLPLLDTGLGINLIQEGPLDKDCKSSVILSWIQGPWTPTWNLVAQVSWESLMELLGRGDQDLNPVLQTQCFQVKGQGCDKTFQFDCSRELNFPVQGSLRIWIQDSGGKPVRVTGLELKLDKVKCKASPEEILIDPGYHGSVYQVLDPGDLIQFNHFRSVTFLVHTKEPQGPLTLFGVCKVPNELFFGEQSKGLVYHWS